MSIFNCNITFKMVEGDSLTSTLNKLVAHNIIRKDWSIVSPAKARIAIQELNEEAKEVLGVSVQMFEEDGITLFPNVDEFDRIDGLKKIQAEQTNLDNREGIDYIYSQNPELESIGSKEEYSEYIKTIFPESKVQDIVYRGSEKGIEKGFQNWLYFTNNKNEATIYAKTNFTKGGNITERNPFSNIYINFKKYINSKYGEKTLESFELVEEDYLEQISEDEFELKLPDWYNKDVLLETEDFELFKSLQTLKNNYDIIKIENENDLDKPYTVQNYYKYKKEYDEARNNLNSFFKIENIGIIEPVLLNIKNPYIREIVQEDLYDDRDAYRNGHDGALLMGGDHFLIRKNKGQYFILGNLSDIKGFKKFVGKEEIKYQSSNKQIQNLSNEAVNWIKSVLPNSNVELQQDLIDGIANGSFNTVNELITLSEKYANKKTAKHEMFHLAFNRLSKQKQDELLNEGSKLFNIPRGESKVTTKYSLSQQNEINYVLKSVDILQSDKAKQVFEKGEKNKWDLDKIFIELAVPKEQRALIKEVYNNNLFANPKTGNLIELTSKELALLVANQYSYVIEINTTQEINNDAILDNTNYYSNLTVPGGINYTEQEIATPLIIPSIKGHAQFATDSGIGWFRSDEQTKQNTSELIFQEDLSGEMSGFQQEYSIGGISSKTRRILELQSDLFQKGRDKENLVLENKIREFEESLQRDRNYATQLFNSQIEEINYINESLYEQGIISKQEMIESIKIESESLTLDSFNQQELELNILKDKLNKQNQFLQLLNKDGNWVTFFTKAIIQDSNKKGYEKVLFPTGNTASKVEGHTTLEEFKKQKEDRIKELEKNRQKQINGKAILYDVDENSFATEPTIVAVSILDNEINQLKQEIENVEKEGFGALKPIYNFYENTVTNILKKQGFSPKLITDEYGNTWNEIDLNDVKIKEQIQTIKFQSPKLEYKGDLAIEEKIAEMMENTPDEKIPKTILGKWIQSVRNFFRNLFKERTKVQQLLRNINQGIIPVKEYEMSPTDGLYDFTCTI